MAKRVSLKGKGADLFFGNYAPTEQDAETVEAASEQAHTALPEVVEVSAPPPTRASGSAKANPVMTTSTQVVKPTNAQVAKRASGRVEESTQPVVVKYTTHLRPETIKALKRVAFEGERKDYEVVQEALDAYLKSLRR